MKSVRRRSKPTTPDVLSNEAATPIDRRSIAAVATDQIREQRRTVGFDSYDVTIRQIVDMVTEKAIKISPEYQRHFVWGAERQSQLIESVFLGIPIPSLFMATNKEDSTWEVVDGLQRITTLINFVNPDPATIKHLTNIQELRLSGLEKLTSLNGQVLADLGPNLRLNFLTRPIRITVLNDLSDYQLRFDLFERLNTGGIVLHEQEIRNCIFIGPFNDFIKEQAKDPRILALVKRTDLNGRGNLEELVLKFFAYFENSEVFPNLVKDFLNNYMDEKTRSFRNRSRLARVFDETLTALVDALPNGIVRKDRPNTTPLVLFEAIAVGVALALDDGETIDKKKLQAMLDNDQLRALTTAGTNNRKKLLERLKIVKEGVVK